MCQGSIQETKEESRDESRRNQAGTGESSSLTGCGFTLLTTSVIMWEIDRELKVPPVSSVSLVSVARCCRAAVPLGNILTDGLPITR